MGGRRSGRGVSLEATSQPQHGHRSSRWCACDRVLQFPEEGQEACRRFHDEVLLRTARADALHGRVRCTPVAADGGPGGSTLACRDTWRTVDFGQVRLDLTAGTHRAITYNRGVAARARTRRLAI